MTDYPGCLYCGKPFPPGVRVDRRYCDRRCNDRHYKKGRGPKILLPDPVSLLARMTPQQLGWVVGIVEGEGCISCHVTPRINNDYVYAQVTVAMADEDVIRRLGEWAGIGRINGPHLSPCRAEAGHKPQWKWHVTRWAEVDALIDVLWPLLGERRRQQAVVVRQRMANRVLKRSVKRE